MNFNFFLTLFLILFNLYFFPHKKMIQYQFTDCHIKINISFVMKLRFPISKTKKYLPLKESILYTLMESSIIQSFFFYISHKRFYQNKKRKYENPFTISTFNRLHAIAFYEDVKHTKIHHYFQATQQGER